MSFAVKNAIPFVDDLVKEYLVFRGFNKTLQTFEAERKADKLKGFEVGYFAPAVSALIVTNR